MIHRVWNVEEYEKHVRDAGDKLVVANFTVSWCKISRIMDTVFVELAEEYTNVIFLKVDVDDAKDVSALHEITNTPTFIFYRSQQQVFRFSGASVGDLRGNVHMLSKPRNADYT